MTTKTKQTLKIYFQHVRRYPLLAAIIVISVIGGSAMGVVIPLYFKRFFDVLASGSAAETIVQSLISILIAIAVIEGVRWIFWRIATFANSYFQTRIIAELSNQSFEYLHKHSWTFFNNNFVGSLVKRVNWFTRAFEGLADKVVWTFLPLLTDLTMVVFILGRKHLYLGVGIVIWLVIFLIVNWYLTKYKFKFDLQRNESETKATGVLADTITNQSNVKLFVGYNREVERYGQANDKVRRLRLLTWNLDGLFEAVQGLLVVALEIGIFYGAIQLWKRGVLTIGDFVLLQSFMIIIFEKVWGFGKVIRHMYSELADAEEMTRILETPHEIQDSPAAKQLQVARGEIAFKEVDFYYHETRRIFSKLNLRVAPHEKVAFVGPSGAGKSTVVKLLLRLHDVSGGKILIDNQPITHVTQESLWENVSLVPQDPILFHRTLMENIRYGRPNATDEKVIEAAKLAHCHEFISEFPDKYNTFVGERGVKLSGGERQRVAIARAILRNAPILVLDEATSSLDSESEALIQDALSTLMKNKTVIVIAHRLSTIMRMDRIVVLDKGKVVEEGTHQALVQKPQGLYRQLWKLQAGGFLQDVPPPTAETELGRDAVQFK